MIIRDLFFNTPARLKFMKTDKAEGAGVSAQVICCALSHPEVSVRYIKDGKEECHTPGDGRIDSCIYSLFGREFAGGLLRASTSDGAVSAAGYISAPVCARGNRSYQYFFINGRYVKSKTLQAALEQAYKNVLFTGRFPSCVLYITLSPCDVDVNVHPTKTEVKFLNEHQVFDSVYYAALAALETEGRSPEITLSEGTKELLHTAKPTNLEAEKLPYQPKPVTDYQKLGKAYNTYAQERLPSAYSSGGVQTRLPSVPETTVYRPIHDETTVLYKAKEEIIETEKTSALQSRFDETEAAAEQPHRFVGEALGTYILAEKGGSLWLIDKHAAHERINFDRLKDGKQVTMSQTLVQPVIIHLGREDTVLLAENGATLERLGFSVEAFGEATLAVREIPSGIDIGEVESTLGEMAQILRRGGSPDDGLILDELMHSIACKSAIKAGHRSEPLELEALIDKVLSGEVRYCPHGRPVAVELTQASLDRQFKRT